ncbi:MAG: hypothetical protein K2X47_06850 [Bdellovibrionales bacterium]|nr:hypothetical protein [Bdellovibrionales bacterium]
MRLFLVVGTFLATSVASSDAEKIRNFLKRQDICQFAVYEVARSKKLRAKLPPLPSVRCVDDMVVGKGTVNEKEGCAAFLFNVETGRQSPLKPEFGANIVEKKCADGGFEDVMNQTLYSIEKKKVLVRSEFEQLKFPSKGYRLVLRVSQNKFASFVGLPENVDLGTIDEGK